MTKKEAIFKLVNSEISLKDIPELNDDKEIVLTAVSLNYLEVENISDKLLCNIEFLHDLTPYLKKRVFLRDVSPTIFNNKILVDEIFDISNGKLIVNYTISLETENYKILANGPLLISSNASNIETFSLRNIRVEDYNGKIPYQNKSEKIPYPVIEQMPVFNYRGGYTSSPEICFYWGGYGIHKNKIQFSKEKVNNLGGDIGKYFISHYVPQIIELEQSIGKLKLIDWTDNMTWDGRTLTIKPKS